jgi:hypothetical protein
VISAASTRCICDVEAQVSGLSQPPLSAAHTPSLQVASSAAVQSICITWSDSLHWELSASDDASRAFCSALLRTCPAPARRVIAAGHQALQRDVNAGAAAVMCD